MNIYIYIYINAQEFMRAYIVYLSSKVVYNTIYEFSGKLASNFIILIIATKFLLTKSSIIVKLSFTFNLPNKIK